MSKFTRMASTDVQEESVKLVENACKTAKVHLWGGTTIGKKSVILDLTHQGGEIHVESSGDITISMPNGFDKDVAREKLIEALQEFETMRIEELKVTVKF